MSIHQHIQRVTVVLILAVMGLTGCGLSGAAAPTGTIELKTADTPAGEVAMKESAAVGTMAEEPVMEYDLADESVAAAPAPMATAAPAMAVDAAVSRGEAPAAEMVIQQQADPLRAGEVNDNQQWDDYLLYRRNYAGPAIHPRDISERYAITVTDGQGFPVLGAEVRISIPGQNPQEIYRARTMANGQVLFHPLALDASLEQVDTFLVQVVQQGEQSQQFELTRLSAQPATSFTDHWTASLNQALQPVESINLDIMFLVDATGSMSDEIAKIQSTIFEVSASIDSLPGRPNVRYGLVTYRDRGDAYVTRSADFTPNVSDFSDSLDMVRADGGGDYPESLNEGLHDALHNVEWRGDDTVKLIFLIADAPPHLDYAQDYDYAVEMDTAAQQGIKIFPIASSGLDDQGEYIFRQIAQYTQGQFIFLTYDGPTNGGAPGDTTTHHVDDYSVENLDRLLVRLVETELAHQNRQLAQTLQ
jgi:hypothetical protein